MDGDQRSEDTDVADIAQFLMSSLAWNQQLQKGHGATSPDENCIEAITVKVTLCRQNTYHKIHKHKIVITNAFKALVRLKKGTQYDRYTTSLCVNFKILIVFLLGS